MNINKDLNRDSSTKDLLKFATEHGYHDNEGMDNSPSWMSQELDERAFAESKSCHPVLVKGEIPMTNTDKRLKEGIHKILQEELADSSIYQDSYAELTLKRHLQNTESRLSTLIHQALAEEKERVEEMRNAPPPFSADEKNPMKHIYQNQGYVRALDDFLSLDTNKE